MQNHNFLSILQLIFAIVLLIPTTSIIKAQTQVNYFADYYPLTNQAELNYIDSDYEAALKHYQTAFEKQEPLRYDLVEAAKTAIKLDNKELAISYLLKAFEKGTTLKFIKKQEDFAAFENHHWRTLKEAYPQRYQQFSSQVNYALKKEIAQMEKVDQKYRKKIKRYQKHFKVQNKMDSLQAVRLMKIIEEHGWMGEQLIGITSNQEKYKTANPAYFIVLLHCHSSYRKDYFIPLLTQKAKEGLCSPRMAALLMDQTELYSGKLQRYGTYGCKNEGVRMPCRLADEEKVNELRASIGLESFEDYLKKNDMEYTWKPLEGKSEKPNK
ncbi:MAG: hypothetical protein ACPG49_12505 [Chitinophagales bacterium]